MTSEFLSLNTLDFWRTLATGLFLSCAVGIWRMHAQLGALNASLLAINRRLDEYYDRILRLESAKKGTLIHAT